MATGYNGVGVPVVERKRARHGTGEWAKRHPLLFVAAKWILVTMLASMFAGGGWLMLDVRDAMRDSSEAAKQLPSIQTRMRAVEDRQIEQGVDLKWIRQRLSQGGATP